MVDKFSNPEEARFYLITVGQQDDRDIDLFQAALALAAVHRPSISVDQYRQHMAMFCEELRNEFDRLCAQENSDNVMVQGQALRVVMAQKHGYSGDSADYNNLQNADVMRTIDRRLGLPITLSIIGISACRQLGWGAEGLNFPGHFIMRLDQEGERSIIDPFQSCKELRAPELRQILKKNMGDDAELSSDYYEACSNRDILLRLQNNIKFRLIDTEHYQEALEIVDLMELIAPDDYRLDLDTAVLLARLERPKAAVERLVKYINHVQDSADKAEAEMFLHELKSILH